MVAHFKQVDGKQVRSDHIVSPAAEENLSSLKDEIHSRMALPSNEWVPMDGDTVFDDVVTMLRAGTLNG